MELRCDYCGTPAEHYLCYRRFPGGPLQLDPVLVARLHSAPCGLLCFFSLPPEALAKASVESYHRPLGRCEACGGNELSSAA